MPFPLDDTLNLRNGINFAQFLECILRIAYMKKGEHETYKFVLQNIFQDASLEIKNKAQQDELAAELYSAECQRIFYENYHLLAALFNARALIFPETHLELEKQELMHVFEEASLFEGLPEPEEGKL